MLVLGIDLGTSSCKTILVNQKGEMVNSSSFNYPLSIPNAFWSEQDPKDWWDAMVKSIHKVMLGHSADEVKGIGLSGQMSGLVLLDKAYQVLRPAILWNDGRSQKECEILSKEIPNVLKETGNYPISGLVAPKLLWLQRHEPSLWNRVKTLLLPKDYLRFKLTGENITDMTDSSLTLLLNVRERAWSKTMLKACNIDESYLGRLVEGCEISGQLSLEAANILNLRAGIPIVGGAGDQPAAAIGIGCISPGQTLISLGTSGVVLSVTDHYQENFEKSLNNCCHALPNTWFHMGVMLSAAGSLQWYRDTCATNLDFNSICEETKHAPIGSEGLLFLPYLTGERTPHCDPYLKGAFIGLSRKHERAHLSRAVLEGIGMGLYQSLALMQKSGVSIKEAFINGAGTQNRVWMQMIADIFKIRLIQLEKAEVASALGAARLALIGCCQADKKEISATGNTINYFEPEPEAAALYQEKIAQFQRIHPLLKEYSSQRVAEIQ